MHTGEETPGESLVSAGQTILIIDDNPTNLAVVGEFLSKQGFQVMVALSGELGLELARNDLEGLDRQLAAKDAQAPNFFSNAPLVLALDKLPASEGADHLPALIRICRNHVLRTLEIRATRIQDI